MPSARASMDTLPKLRSGTPMSIPAILPVVAELEPDGARPVDRLPLDRPAVTEEEVRALVPDVVHEECGAPALALEPDPEIAGLVGFLDLHAAGRHDRLDAREVVHRLADIGQVEPREGL